MMEYNNTATKEIATMVITILASLLSLLKMLSIVINTSYLGANIINNPEMTKHFGIFFLKNLNFLFPARVSGLR